MRCGLSFLRTPSMQGRLCANRSRQAIEAPSDITGHRTGGAGRDDPSEADATGFFGAGAAVGAGAGVGDGVGAAAEALEEADDSDFR